MSIMNLDDLKASRDLIKTQFDNLSNPQWVANELQHLRGKYDILSEVIEGEQRAKDNISPTPNVNSGSERKQAVQGKTKG